MTFIEFLNQIFAKKPITPVTPVQTKEDYYNNKYPKSNITYNRTETDGNYNIDVRLFANPKQSLPIITGVKDDDKALNGVTWVIDNITYTPDNSNSTYKTNEYWAYAYQTLKHKAGDCEDGAILLYNILRANGIPAWKLRISAGWVLLNKEKVGHAYLTYYVEEADKWVVLDWCYWPNKFPVIVRKDYKEESNYLDVWFSFNEDYAWCKGLNTSAKQLLNINAKKI